MKRFQARIGINGDIPINCQNNESLKPIMGNVFLFLDTFLTSTYNDILEIIPHKTSQNGA